MTPADAPGAMCRSLTCSHHTCGKPIQVTAAPVALMQPNINHSGCGQARTLRSRGACPCAQTRSRQAQGGGRYGDAIRVRLKAKSAARSIASNTATLPPMYSQLLLNRVYQLRSCHIPAATYLRPVQEIRVPDKASRTSFKSP